jgi:ribulose-phosphate 3-epimerase
MALVCPSLRAADFSRLAEELEIVRAAGARMVHIDVSDGHFNPDVAFGVPVIESIRKATDLTLDVHLLVERPERFVHDFVEAGADRIAIHAEATPNIYRALSVIRSEGAVAGIALRAGSPLGSVTEVVGDLDFLNILCADPEEGDEGYIPHSAMKLRAAVELRARHEAQFSLEVEGAINLDRLEPAIRAGANIVVAGACFGQPDPGASLKEWFKRASVASEEIEIGGNVFGGHE